MARFTRLLADHAAVHAGHGAQHERPRAVLAERRLEAVADPGDHHALALLGALDAGPRDVLRRRTDERRARVLRLEPAGLDELGRDRARAQSGHGHARAAQLRRHGLAEAPHECLGRRINGLHGDRLEGRGRGDIDHRARAAIDHAGKPLGSSGPPAPRR